MKKAGVLISDAKLLYELIEVLRKEGIPFEIADPNHPMKGAGVLLTTERDYPKQASPKIINCSLDSIHRCAKIAKAALSDKRRIRSLVVGIDPGSCPGVAVLADQSVIDTAAVKAPDLVAEAVRDFVEVYPSDEVLVRIGNGDRTIRNRIFNSIWDMGIPIEIVDERNTSTPCEQKDIEAAIEIALTPGYRPVKKQSVSPSEGEIADIQRKSRIGSEGEITISHALATGVAKGEITMEEAIERQRLGRKS